MFFVCSSEEFPPRHFRRMLVEIRDKVGQQGLLSCSAGLMSVDILSCGLQVGVGEVLQQAVPFVGGHVGGSLQNGRRSRGTVPGFNLLSDAGSSENASMTLRVNCGTTALHPPVWCRRQ